ncbi:MAG: class I SAM-dependent DNA methyltransferase [Candidatus Puniceispirillaceae bacterium]
MSNNTGPSASGAGSNVRLDEGPVTGPDEVWLERTPTATGEIDISVAYANPPTDELMALYAAWADSYDTDLTDVYGYRAPADAVAALIALDVPRHARILDAGCGTGQAGALLAAAGYTHVDGADLSPEMRAVAARLGVYRHLFDLDMTADYAPQLAAANEAAGAKISDDGAADGRPDVPHDARPTRIYDAVICVGVFGYGPPHINDLPRIMDAAGPGAPVLVTVNGMGWVKMGWEAALAPTLKAAGVELRARARIRHMVNEGIHAELLNLRRG